MRCCTPNVFRLRRALAQVEPEGDQRIAFTTGYRLRVEPGELDLTVFRDHVRRGRADAAAGRHQRASTELRAALDQWRGSALTGVSDRYFEAEIVRLEDERLAAVEDRIEVDLALGEHSEAISELQDLTGRNPHRERLHGQLMVALSRAGRQAEALQVFRNLRQTLIDELGIDPGAQLRELHERVLRGDIEPVAPPSVDRRVRRNDLPADVLDFTGREDETQRLLATLPGDGTAVVINAVDGMAGVGKTTFAVHVAHRLTDLFPDAQVFIDLHGHSTEREAVAPATALDHLLRALGVPSSAIPHDLDQRAALWRAELAERKALVVLDNAANAAQVRPLLPGAAGCLALITSRRHLADLEAAQILSLAVLPPDDAVDLFTRIAGQERIEAEPEAVRDVVKLSGYLPLAIRIAAARLRSRTTWTVSHLAERLREGQQRLTELTIGDRSVAAAFALSYKHLSAEQQRLFRLLGLHPGADFDVHASANLADLQPATAQLLLEDLVDVHLLQLSSPGRYRFHDLLREHARSTAEETDSAARLEASLTRLIDFYLHTSLTAVSILDSVLPKVEAKPPGIGHHPFLLDDETSAWRWFTVENQNLLAAQRLALGKGWHAPVWQLAWALNPFHNWKGLNHDALVVRRAALVAADQLGETAIQVQTHRQLSYIYARTGHHTVALEHLHQALRLAEDAGDLEGQAATHRAFARAYELQQQNDREALAHATQALNLFEILDLPRMVGRQHSQMGWHHARLGNHDEARTHCEAGLIVSRQHHDRVGASLAFDSLGYVAFLSGRHEQAVDYYQQAVEAYNDLHEVHEQAHALERLGQAEHALNRYAQARASWQRALDMFRVQHLVKDAERVQLYLDLLADR
ncbi:AfsR/SARP family transcriptional regulator [Solihabitans fulvus]|uniref:AfsR/SARP family transcriptional regulator n=1 Tax=Solihabitans fulvus TaxID=1892852 RepID=UPI001661E417|nr:BTAD domain-containing putative transcriptional regulator [Solihabitans fulvus]